MKIISNKKLPRNGLFNAREIVKIFEWDKSKKWKDIEYQCPICKRWFCSSCGWFNTMAVRLHISRTAKSEAVAKCLGTINKIPHFNFWRENTKEINVLYKPREWNIF